MIQCAYGVSTTTRPNIATGSALSLSSNNSSITACVRGKIGSPPIPCNILAITIIPKDCDIPHKKDEIVKINKQAKKIHSKITNEIQKLALECSENLTDEMLEDLQNILKQIRTSLTEKFDVKFE